MIAAMVVITFGMLIFLPGAGARPVRVAMGFFGGPMLGFFAFRWHVLRRRVFSGEISAAEFRRDPRGHVLGPRLPVVIWFVITLVLLIGIVVVGAELHL